jgi:uncharacterized protein (TIGR03435 family)
MDMTTSVVSLALLTGLAAWGQVAPPLAFDVASVKPTPPSAPWREAKAGVDRIDFPGTTLRYNIAFAYGVKEYQISGPPWLADAKFDILAKGPEGTTREQLPEMMRALLAERFKLQVHHETKEFSVFVLSVGKNGPKLTETAPDPDGYPTGANFSMSMNNAGIGRMEAKAATMTSLVNTIARMIGRPVLDRTGLTGRYDFALEFARDDGRGFAGPPPPNSNPLPSGETGVSIFASVQQIGLKLDNQKLPLDAIVVDRAEKVASEN